LDSLSELFFFFFQNSPDFKELKNSKCDNI